MLVTDFKKYSSFNECNFQVGEVNNIQQKLSLTTVSDYHFNIYYCQERIKFLCILLVFCPSYFEDIPF